MYVVWSHFRTRNNNKRDFPSGWLLSLLYLFFFYRCKPIQLQYILFKIQFYPLNKMDFQVSSSILSHKWSVLLVEIVSEIITPLSSLINHGYSFLKWTVKRVFRLVVRNSRVTERLWCFQACRDSRKEDEMRRHSRQSLRTLWWIRFGA